MPAKKARQQGYHPQQQHAADEGGVHLEQLPQQVLQQVADLCADSNTPAAAHWAPVCNSWRTAAATTTGPPLSFACGKHLSPALYVRRSRSLFRFGAASAKRHLPITPVLWASHRDVTRATSLSAWLRYNAASVPELAVQAVTAGHAQLALPVRVYRQLRLDWADAHAALFEGLGAGGEGGEEGTAAAAAGAGLSTKGAPYLTRLQLPGLGHVPAPTLAAGLAACPALESLSLPFTWPQWIKARTSPQASPLYEALRGLTRLVKLELGVEGLQAGDWQEEEAAGAGAAAAAAEGATGGRAAPAAEAAAGAAAAEVADSGADSDYQVPSLLDSVRGMDKAPDHVNLTPLFEGLPSSIEEVLLTGSCKCILHLSSLQHLSNLRQLQLPDVVVFEGADRADLAALTALTELRGNDVLSAGSEPLLRVPNLRRLVAPVAALAAAGPLAALVEQEQLRELEVTYCESAGHERYISELDGLRAAEAAWEELVATLPKLQQLTSLVLTCVNEVLGNGPSAEEPAAAIKQMVNLQQLTMPVECVLGAEAPAVLPKALTALTLTLGSGISQAEPPAEDEDPPLLLPALSAVSRAVVPDLKSVDFRPWSGSAKPPTQQQYEELQQGSQALPARIKVLWGGTPLQQVVPLPPPVVVPEAAAAAAKGGGAEAAAAAAGEGANAAEPAVEAAEGGGEAAAAGGVAGAAAAGGAGGDGDVQMAEAEPGE